MQIPNLRYHSNLWLKWSLQVWVCHLKRAIKRLLSNNSKTLEGISGPTMEILALIQWTAQIKIIIWGWWEFHYRNKIHSTKDILVKWWLTVRIINHRCFLRTQLTEFRQCLNSKSHRQYSFQPRHWTTHKPLNMF